MHETACSSCLTVSQSQYLQDCMPMHGQCNVEYRRGRTEGLEGGMVEEGWGVGSAACVSA